MKKIILSLLLVLGAVTSYSQTNIVGGGGQCKVDGDPDNHPVIDEASLSNCWLAVDTTDGTVYRYFPNKTLGDRWDVFIATATNVTTGSGAPTFSGSENEGDFYVDVTDVTNPIGYVFDADVSNWIQVNAGDRQLGTHDQLLTGNRITDFDGNTYTWDLSNMPLDAMAWRVLTPDSKVLGWYVADGAGDIKFVTDGILTSDFQNIALYSGDRITYGSVSDSIYLQGESLFLDFDSLNTDNSLTELVAINPVTKELKLVDAGTITGSGAATILHNVDSLKAYSAVSDGLLLQVSGYYDYDDGGGGLFWYDNTSTVANNGGTVIIPTFAGFTGTGRWLRVQEETYYGLKTFGAKGDSITLDQTAWDAWLTACIADKVDAYITPTDQSYRIDAEASERVYQDITIFGDGPKSKVYYGGSPGRVQVFHLANGSNNVTFDNFQVRISSQKNTLFENGVFCARDGADTLSNITIQRITATNEVKDKSDGGFHFISFHPGTDADNGYLTNLRVYDNYVYTYGKDAYGIHLLMNGEDVWIQNNQVWLHEYGQNGLGDESFNAYAIYGSLKNVFVNNNIGQSGHSIFAISPGQNVLVSNNLAVNCLTPVEAAYEGEWKAHNPDTTTIDVTFADNRSENCTYGVLITTRDYTTIVDTTIYAPPHRIRVHGHISYRDGISLHIADRVNNANPWETDRSTESYDIQISDFQSVESTTAGENAAGIQIFNGYKILLDGFQIVDPAGSGVVLGRDQADLYPQNVSIKNGQIYNPVRSGVQTKGCDSLLTISSVEIHNPGLYGVGAFNASDHDYVKINDLTVINSVLDGVYFRNQLDTKLLQVTNSSFINIGDRPFDTNITNVLHDGNVYYGYVNVLQSNGTTVAGDNIDIASP